MINWLANRIHAASLEANYDWVTVEHPSGKWEARSTHLNPDISHIFESEDQAEAFLDRHCARQAAIHVLCFWRKNP